VIESNSSGVKSHRVQEPEAERKEKQKLRQRVRRAKWSPEKRKEEAQKQAFRRKPSTSEQNEEHRLKIAAIRAKWSPERKTEEISKARERRHNETPEQHRERNRKGAERHRKAYSVKMEAQERESREAHLNMQFQKYVEDVIGQLPSLGNINDTNDVLGTAPEQPSHFYVALRRTWRHCLVWRRPWSYAEGPQRCIVTQKILQTTTN
jgi:hypothetical protein